MINDTKMGEKAFFDVMRTHTMRNNIDAKIRLRTEQRMRSFDRQFSGGFNKFIQKIEVIQMANKKLDWFYGGEDTDVEDCDIYEDEGVEELFDADEISDAEEGFMFGYLGG